MRKLVLKIKETYYKHVAWFCKRRADKAFEKQEPYSYECWERLVSKYCNKYMVIRES